MEIISRKMEKTLSGGSWIRKMFEAGIALKKEHGEQAVCDFSLGNPDLAPPTKVVDGLANLVDKVRKPFSLGYMPNAGFPQARAQLAEHLGLEQGVKLVGDDVVLTCGAAGGLNIVLKAILEPTDEVITIAPLFVDYGAYIENHQGRLVMVQSQPNTFALDIKAIAEAINPNTRAILINNPNNPTGAVYPRQYLLALAQVLVEATAKHGRPIYLISDEPYRFLAYSGVDVPSILPIYPYAIVVSSFSKSLCLAGERVGYVALSPLLEERAKLMGALIACNRMLGYINAPVIGQYLMQDALGSQVDVSIYSKRRDLMADILTDAGYEFTLPKGTFYFFPKAPGGDDLAFVDALVKELILAVPGRGFYGPGHFRLAFCVDDAVIIRSAPGFKRAIEAFKS